MRNRLLYKYTLATINEKMSFPCNDILIHNWKTKVFKTIQADNALDLCLKLYNNTASVVRIPSDHEKIKLSWHCYYSDLTNKIETCL